MRLRPITEILKEYKQHLCIQIFAQWQSGDFMTVDHVIAIFTDFTTSLFLVVLSFCIWIFTPDFFYLSLKIDRKYAQMSKYLFSLCKYFAITLCSVEFQSFLRFPIDPFTIPVLFGTRLQVNMISSWPISQLTGMVLVFFFFFFQFYIHWYRNVYDHMGSFFVVVYSLLSVHCLRVCMYGCRNLSMFCFPGQSLVSLTPYVCLVLSVYVVSIFVIWVILSRSSVVYHLIFCFADSVNFFSVFILV